MIQIESTGVPIKAWVEGVQVEEAARKQLQAIARLPVVGPHLAVMPDVHLGKGATVGSVVPTRGAIIPAAVGVDIGCGMMAVKTNLRAEDLPNNLEKMRARIEAAVPHGRSNNGGPGDVGAWSDVPREVELTWQTFVDRYNWMVAKHPRMRAYNSVQHLGTLGTGNHFIEVCLGRDVTCPNCQGSGVCWVDRGHGDIRDIDCECVGGKDSVWVMLHSGSRGVGNRIGSYFIERAKRDMLSAHGNLPEDEDLAYLTEGTEHFADYVEAVDWAQDFARVNRQIMMERTLDVINDVMRITGVVGEGRRLGEVGAIAKAINCHHNYVQPETHFGERLYITRKGAVRAGRGDLGIIPGSMGARSFIVQGKGNAESFESCSHGAGRSMSRGEAKRRFTIDDHVRATDGIECRKDADVIDETPMAYKPIDQVMAAQADLVEVVAELRQVLCVKG